MEREELELLAPAGSRESLSAALRGGADAVYFGIGRLNMRAHSAANFRADDLGYVVEQCRLRGVRAYLTLNTTVYEDDLEEMRRTVDAAAQAGVDAVIASDVATMQYCRERGVAVHLSTQLNIANAEALGFYAQFADVAVLARELTLWQVADIHRLIDERHITGPGGQPMRIEMFCHGALCMAVSGRCYLSLHNADGRSANRGECVQICRRAYTVTDRDDGTQLDIDNKYVLSPRDLCTLPFLDVLANAGVRVFKIEGRARGPEYVRTVCECYDEALRAVCDGTFHHDERRKELWMARLSTVFNRGFWDGYYQGARLGQWSNVYGSQATEQKIYAGRCVKYFSRIGVGEFVVEAEPVNVGDRLLCTGGTTGAVVFTADEIRFDLLPVSRAQRGQHVSIRTPERVRENDRLYVLRRRTLAQP